MVVELAESNPLVVALGGLVASVCAVQVFTSADPVGRCLVFFKQLRGQVRMRLFLFVL